MEYNKITLPYPKEYKYVRTDKNLFLLNTFYVRDLDRLFVLYKDMTTGEKILDEFDAPVVPVWISKIRLTKPKEYMEVDSLNRFMVPYKTKEQEIRGMTLSGKLIKYTDKNTGKLIRKTLYPDVPRGAEYLNPNIFGLDIPIEHFIYKQWCLNRYESQNGVHFENITYPEMHLGAFDIETIPADERRCEVLKYGKVVNEYPDDYEEEIFYKINVITFIDDKSKTAYLYYLNDKRCPRIEEIELHKEKFTAELKAALYQSISEAYIFGKDLTVIKKICNDYCDELKVVTRVFESEDDLISQSIKLMYFDVKPDINMAFNMTFDIGVIQRRIEELGMPVGLFNANKKYVNTYPPFRRQIEDTQEQVKEFMYKLDRPWEWRGDSIQEPDTRMIEFNMYNKVCNWDFQTIYYNNIKHLTVPSVSLEDTSNRVLGFGKHDYSHLTNSIAKLPFVDFWQHSIYAIIDSLLIILNNKITYDVLSKLSFMCRVKTPIMDSCQATKSIGRCIHTDAFYRGHIPSCNGNRILNRLDMTELKKVEELFGVDYLQKTKTNINKRNDKEVRVGGGIVINPELMTINQDVLTAGMVLKDEVRLSNFMKFLNVLYMDFKSHYPYTITSNNVAKDSYFGSVDTIFDSLTKDILYSRSVRQDSKNYVDNLGFVIMPIIDDNAVSYGEKLMNLPSLAEICKRLEMNLDSEPVVTPSLPLSFKIDVVGKVLRDITTFMGKLNKRRITDTQEGRYQKDRGYFFLTDGEHEYRGDAVKYINHGMSLYKTLTMQDAAEPVYVKKSTETLTSLVYKYEVEHGTKKIKMERLDRVKPLAFPYVELTGEWTKVGIETLKEIEASDRDLFKITLGGVTMSSHKDVILFPVTEYLKKLPHFQSNKLNFLVTELEYRTLVKEATSQIEFRFFIKSDPINLNLEIRQLGSWINL